ncbi:long-chain-fatty-acid--CoA ligase ACSBG2-like [Palaemon carinicauda]|uniref:long-chain-fatty-acid--CoA ligase ACSBG2-like n=1 Tax=Palaemon carinicauda TaxID=392227 RepID=UPI0035B5AFF1
MSESAYHQPEFLNGPDQLIPSDNLKTWELTGSVKLRIGDEGVLARTPISVPSFLIRSAEKYPLVTAMAVKRNGVWRETTYKDYYEQVRTVAKAFIKLGLKPFHGVCIHGFNSPEWFISNLAAIFAGGVSVGVYTTNSPEACAHCAQTSKAQIYVVEDQKQLEKILRIREDLPFLHTVIQYSGKPTVKGILSWDEVMKLGRQQPDTELEEKLRRIAINQCCTLIFSSGTTGPPKGVMLSHDNLTWTAHANSVNIDLVPEKESIISFLPLSHIAAQMADIYICMYAGGTCYFAQPDALKESLGATLKEVRPTVMIGVPRVWEKIYEKMTEAVQNTVIVKRLIISWARSIGLAAHERRQLQNFRKPLCFPIANAIVFKKAKSALGLDRCNVFISAAAPISPDVVNYFHSLDITLTEVYGMSESSGPHTIGLLNAFKTGSCGLTPPGFSTRVFTDDEDGYGEVYLTGRNITMGYLNMRKETNEAIDDEGWLHTGDIGRVDEHNFLYITGRLKEIIITAGGENIAPEPIEAKVKAELPCISQCMLIGDKRKFLSILLTLKTDIDAENGEPLDTLTPLTQEWFRNIGAQVQTVQQVLMSSSENVTRAIYEGIERANKLAISNAQRIRKWAILPKDFSQRGDELGPTSKLKRHIVLQKYSDVIEKFYE